MKPATQPSAPAVSVSAISVKTTTTEKLGYVGREEDISAYAVILLQPIT